jgi:hypothetical protein
MQKTGIIGDTIFCRRRQRDYHYQSWRLVNRPKDFTVIRENHARERYAVVIQRASCFRYGKRDLSERAEPLKMKITRSFSRQMINIINSRYVNMCMYYFQ